MFFDDERSHRLRPQILTELVSQYMNDAERAAFYGLPSTCRVRERVAAQWHGISQAAILLIRAVHFVQVRLRQFARVAGRQIQPGLELRHPIARGPQGIAHRLKRTCWCSDPGYSAERAATVCPGQPRGQTPVGRLQRLRRTNRPARTCPWL